MRRFVPLVAQTARRFVPAVAHDQAFDTLVLASASVVWTVSNRIVVEYMTDGALGQFALIAWPATLLPFYVRSGGTRYALNDDFTGAPICWSTPYAGQILDDTSVFEFWGDGASGSAALPQISLTISQRTQLCCDETEGYVNTSTQYLPYCQPYPVYFPICIS